jgi:hypothetical protein
MAPLQIQYGINLSCTHDQKCELEGCSSSPGLESILRDLSNGMDPLSTGVARLSLFVLYLETISRLPVTPPPLSSLECGGTKEPYPESNLADISLPVSWIYM